MRQDDDPVIRGLALRSLSSLRVKNLVEYLLAPLEKGLRDNSGYVRSMAVMAVLKLHHLAATTCHDHEYPEILKTMLTKDPDPQVLALIHCEQNQAQGAVLVPLAEPGSAGRAVLLFEVCTPAEANWCCGAGVICANHPLLFYPMQVVANCVYALQEILASDSLESGQPARDRHLLTSKSVIFSLLNRFVHHIHGTFPLAGYCS